MPRTTTVSENGTVFVPSWWQAMPVSTEMHVNQRHFQSHIDLNVPGNLSNKHIVPTFHPPWQSDRNLEQKQKMINMALTIMQQKHPCCGGKLVNKRMVLKFDA